MSRPNASAIQRLKAQLVPQDANRRDVLNYGCVALCISAMAVTCWVGSARCVGQRASFGTLLGCGMAFTATAGVSGWSSYACWQRVEAREAQQRAEPDMIEMRIKQ
jgi:hypothetical protein